ncbi:MAG: universal stress protein [Acidimicrobiales bacterium]|jgi:nucleotide-binding universal stress UspA family protein
MWGRLLLAIDHSDSGQVALEFTARLAADAASEVCVFHVREVPTNIRAVPLENLAEAQLVVEEALSYLRLAGLGAEGRLCSAPDEYVASRIVEASAEWQCGAIVLGSRRLRGLGRLSGRGVRERVLRLSDLPVITAPTPVYERAS